MDTQIRFDGWTLLRSTGELVRGADRVRLQGQPLQVLEALLDYPGELVTREQLIARLWPGGVIVDFDTALNSAIRRLRTALGDHAEHPRYIETIPRRGYRFIGPVEVIAPPDSAGPVVARGASQDDAVAATPPAAVIASPGRRSPRRTAFAIAAAAVIAAMTAGALVTLDHRTTALGVGEQGRGGDTASVDARERHERARFFFGRRDAGDTARALALFEEALRADPAYAAAWAGIASVRWIDTMEGRIPRENGLERVREAAERALALDPSNAEAMMRLANYQRASGNPSEAAAIMRRAAVLAPDDPLVLTVQSGEAMAAGRFDEAVALQRQSVQQNPLAATARHNLVILLFITGHYDEARAEFAELSAISPPQSPPNTVIGQSLLLSGDHRGALEYAQTLPAGVARDQLEALAYFALGRRAEADAALERLTTNPSRSVPHLVAEVHAYRGETDAAFDWLRRSLEAGADRCPPNECWPEAWVPMLPLLRTLHADPRWSSIQTALLAPPAKPRKS